MVKITKSFTIDLEKDGQKITLAPDEIEDIKRTLEDALRQMGREVVQSKKGGGSSGGGGAVRRSALTSRPSSSSSSKQHDVRPHISEEKKREILDHVNKKLSAEPQTLSSLLDGVSYVPNYLPFIRKMVEGQEGVGRKAVGKRTLYFRKGKEEK
jgi:hypothetical protein